MPLIAYLCSSCNHVVKKFHRQVGQAPKSMECDNCQNGELKKQLSAPASTSKISIDNGSMARAVEVNPEIIAINQERANKNYSEED